jgi:hypothetical protein
MSRPDGFLAALAACAAQIGYGLLMISVCLPKKRKVDSSILSLTTRSEQAIRPMTCGNAVPRNQAVVTLCARLRPLMAALRHRMVHARGTPGRNPRGNTAGIEDPRRFLDLAFGYYMSGRFAVINALFVAPNLMHHAVELLIKYTLVKDVPESQRSDATARLRQSTGIGSMHYGSGTRSM